MEINQSNEGIFACQERYANEVLKKFGMENFKPVDTSLVPNVKLTKDDGAMRVDEGLFRSLIGCLLYLTTTRPDLMFASRYLSRFMSNLSELHFRAAKRVLRYVKGSTMLGIWFKKSESLELLGYSDSDWGGSLDDMKNASGYVFLHKLKCNLLAVKETRDCGSVHSKSRVYLCYCSREPSHMAKENS
ncbi:secreted RxLR effector protein 161-like [Pistacia vera]|uniref:secreted RxLR effector protein 161-like n=1 Tax=Pistacia vera TaxID=55513 RepID=UPI001262CC06|nr:secreted RxLR effector protein 161-like [Pistacia vera]